MITLQEIADLTGVTRSTVSKALHNSSDINPETAQKIREAACSLGYNAERLRGEAVGNHTIGIVFPELKSLYYNKIYDFFCGEVAKAGYRTISMLYNFDGVDRQLEDIDFLLRQNVAGILYLTENEVDEERIKSLFRLTQTKLVIITIRTDIGFCDTISNNHALGVKSAVELLYSLGHRKIAFIGERHTRLRCTEFIATMQRLGLEVPRDYIVELSERFENCGYSGMKRLLALPGVPTAVFTAYDNIAYGAMHAIREAGLRIPEDISVVGVDDNLISRYTAPPLTSVNSPESEIGQTAAQMLTERINGSRKPFRNVLLCPSIRVRESIAKPKQ